MADPDLSEAIYVVDDDDRMRLAIQRLLVSVGYKVKTYESAAQFYARDDLGGCRCLIIDVRMPEISGLQLQKQLLEAGEDLAIVFITVYADIPVAVQAMKAGAVEFLQKPFRDQQLLDAVGEALSVNADRERSSAQLDTVALAYDGLSPTEKIVMGYVTAGLMNKQIAAATGRSENTVKIHRARVMQKMGAHTFADLVRMADLLGETMVG